MSLDEFAIINKYFHNIGYRPDLDHTAIKQGVGDDCALLALDSNEWLAVSTDTLVEGVHFPVSARAFEIAQRALAVNLSDLAAQGARPVAFTLSLTMPRADETWLQGFSRGLSVSAQQYGIPLVGGDTTRGPLSVTVQVMGAVPTDAGLSRRGAEFGDLVFVTGSLGDARAALDLLDKPAEGESMQVLLARYYTPPARVALGQKLRGIATACIDVSDGLLADLGHILETSGIAAEIHVDRLPLSPQLLEVSGNDTARRYALSGGDDYELCFTTKDYQRELVLSLGAECGVPVTEIGQIVPGVGIRCRDAIGQLTDVPADGYKHF